MRAIEAHGLCGAYGSRVALEGLTVSVERGVVLGVLGPNGAGKTTTIRILTTILAPHRGTFTIAGIPHTRPSEIRRVIGVLPESAGYPVRQTGEEYLRYHARLFGHTRGTAHTRAQALLKEMGLYDRRTSLIGSYSRGMRQRLGIARTLVNDPTVVFLDEPTLGLDPAGQRQVLRSVRKIASERGAAVLLCSHLLDEVEENCSRVLILNHGRVAADGTVSEVVSRAAAPRSGRVRVAPDDAARAAAALATASGVDHVEREDMQPGLLTVTFTPPGGASSNGFVNAVVRTLLEADVELRSFELEGARLSDAFLAMTEAA